jgi:transposase
MARPAQLTEAMEQEALHMVQQAKSVRELRTGLSILLPKTCGIPNSTVGKMLGVGIATVVRMQRQIRDKTTGSVKQKGKWGGRRRQLMTFEEEKQFLEPWVTKAEGGGILVVPPIHVALEKKLECKIPPSTVYRLLARHGWRKITPDTCHPKRNIEAQEAFKKTSPKIWRKL